MKKIRCFSLAFLLLFSMAACQKEPVISPVEDVPQDTSKVEQAEPAEAGETLQWAEEIPLLTWEPDWTVDSSCADFLDELCDPKYEGRVTGSKGNQAVAQWIKEQFIRMGLDPLPGSDDYLQAFSTDVFEVLPGYAAIIAADGSITELECGVDWCFTPSYVEVDLTLPLSGDLADCEKGIALLDAAKTKQEYPRQYIEVTVSDWKGNTPYFSANGHDNASRLKVTSEVYEKLTEEGAELQLKLPQAARKGEADNVIAYRSGTNGKKAIIISAHFDGSGACGAVMPSAYDNASGMATMLQTAAWLSKAETLPCDVIFAAFNAEEIGLVGSKAFEKRIGEDYEQIFVLNIDCVGWKGEAHVVYAEADQGVLRNHFAGALGLQYKSIDHASDQINFRDSNMLSVLISQEANYIGGSADHIAHGYGDTTDHLDPSSMDHLAKQLCSWVLERGDLAMTSYVVYW